MKNIFAYTGQTGQGYPQYVSINKLDDGNVRVTVRGPAQMVKKPGEPSYLVEGPTINVDVPAAEWERMVSS